MQNENHLSAKVKNELLAMEMRHKKENDRSRTDVLTEIRASEDRIERMISDLQMSLNRRAT